MTEPLPSWPPGTENLNSCPSVLLVPDSLYWAVGSIGRQITHHNPDFRFEMQSEPALTPMLRHFGHHPDPPDVVHFLTPHAANRMRHFFPNSAWTTSLMHNEGPKCTESLAECDAVMVLAEQWFKEAVNLGIPSEQIVQVSLGIDAQRFHPGSLPERNETRRRLGLPDDCFVVGFCGKRSSDTMRRKGTDLFTRAFLSFAEKHGNAAALVMGPGWGEFAKELCASGTPCVEAPFVIDPDEHARRYRCLDLFWVTARIEGGPMPLLEAMATGTACLTTAVGTALDVIEDGVNGVLVPFDDSRFLVDRSLELARDEARRKKIGDAARSYVKSHRRWDQTAPKASLLYRAAISAGQNRLASQARFAAISPSRWHRWKQWMAAREHYRFSLDLTKMQDYEAALVLAHRARRDNPRDLRLWWHEAKTWFRNQAG
jgi:glycosyltransferase involved in cell wall biosynthesis